MPADVHWSDGLSDVGLLERIFNFGARKEREYSKEPQWEPDNRDNRSSQFGGLKCFLGGRWLNQRR
jgi:hypothetical protein